MNKKILMLIITFAFCIGTFAQGIGKNKIKVVGQAEVFATPDVMLFDITLKVKDSLYNRIHEKLVDKYKVLETSLLSIGLTKDDVRSNGVVVSEESKYIKNRSVFDGYSGKMHVSVKRKFSYKLLGAIMFGLKKSDLDYYCSYEFSSDLKQDIKKKVIEEATKDALVKAKIMAKTLGLKLKGVSEIRYGDFRYNREDVIISQDYYDDEEMVAIGSDYNLPAPPVPVITPQKKSIIKSVVVIWNI